MFASKWKNFRGRNSIAHILALKMSENISYKSIQGKTLLLGVVGGLNNHSTPGIYCGVACNNYCNYFTLM